MERLRLVLVGVERAIILGMIARLAENFDVEELVLVSPKADIDEARRYAARAAWRLDKAVIVDSMDEALRGATLSICTSSYQSEDDLLRSPLSPEEAASLAVEAPGTVALVMGRESVGLTRSELEKCNIYSSIPASPKYSSLNLTNATAIYLYVFYKERFKPVVTRGAVDERILRLLEAYARALSSRLAPPDRAGEVVLAVRRLAAKNIASKREVENLLYLLSRACRSLEGCMDEVPRYLQPGGGGGSSGGE